MRVGKNFSASPSKQTVGSASFSEKKLSRCSSQLPAGRLTEVLEGMLEGSRTRSRVLRVLEGGFPTDLYDMCSPPSGSAVGVAWDSARQSRKQREIPVGTPPRSAAGTYAIEDLLSRR